ncbi:MAG: hypothetical protein WBW13_12650, partial [Pseudolabrys sp.]
IGLTDIPRCTAHVRFWGVKRTSKRQAAMFAYDPKQMSSDDIYYSVEDHDDGLADERDLFPRGLFNLRS